MGFCKCSSKTLLGFLGLVFSLAALFLWGSSGFVIATYQEYDNFVSSKFTLIPAVVAIAVGIIFFFAGILGCCSMCKDNKCILTMFGLFMFLLLCLLVAGSALSLMYRDRIEESVRNETDKSLSGYSNHNGTHKEDLDWLQNKLKCCGVSNYTDWLKTDWEKQTRSEKKSPTVDYIPYSCCRSHDNSTCSGKEPIVLNAESKGDYFTEGCEAKVYSIIKTNVRYIGGAIIAFAVLLILGIIGTCCLCCLKKREDTPYFTLN